MSDSVLEMEVRLRDSMSAALKGVNEKIDDLKGTTSAAAKGTRSLSDEINRATDSKRLMMMQVRTLVSSLVGTFGLVGGIVTVVNKLKGMREEWIKVRDETLKTAPVFAAYNEQLKRSADLTRDLIAQRLKLAGHGTTDRLFEAAQTYVDSKPGFWESRFGGDTDEQGNFEAFMSDMRSRARRRVIDEGGGTGWRFSESTQFTSAEIEKLNKYQQEEAELEAKRLEAKRRTLNEEVAILETTKALKDAAKAQAMNLRVGGFQMGADVFGSGISDGQAALDAGFIYGNQSPASSVDFSSIDRDKLKRRMLDFGKMLWAATGLGDDDPHAQWREDQLKKSQQRAAERFESEQEAARVREQFDEVLAAQDDESLDRRRALNARLHDMNAELMRRGSFMGGGFQMSDGTVVNSGLIGGFKDAITDASDLGSQGYGLGQGAFGSFVNSLSNAMTNFATKAQTASEAIREFAASFVASIIQMVNQILASQIAKALFGSIFNSGPDTSSVMGLNEYGPGVDIGGNFDLQAKGGAWSKGTKVTPFAKGGIVSAPTLFGTKGGLGLMGEAGAEAIVPLARTRGGALGVRSTGGESTTVVINAVDGASVEQMLWRNKDALWQLVALGMIQRNDYRASMLGGV